MEIITMRIFRKSILAALAVAATLTSCNPGDFGDINLSPNSPSTPYTDMLFTQACFSQRGFITSTSYDLWQVSWAGYMAEAVNNQFGDLKTTFYFATRDYYYNPMKNLTTIIEMNTNEETKDDVNVRQFGTNNNQIAAAMTLRAWYMLHLTDILGPLPWSEAWKAESDDIWFPKFDSQQEIYTALFNDLEQAYSLFDESSSLSKNDIMYNGNISRWKKFNASMRMDMALRICDVDASTGKTRFAKAYADGGITAAADSYCYQHDNTATYAYLYYIGCMTYASRDLQWGPNKYIVDALKEYKDPRMFRYFTIGDDAYLGKREGDPADYESYFGILYGCESNTVVHEWADKSCSIHQRYCAQTAKYGIFTAARSLFNMAEAATRGWISADAAQLYEQGIRASFEFEGAEGVDDYIAAHPLPSGQDAVKEICMQRWMAGFLTDSIEAWSDWRRTNIPAMKLSDFQQTNNGHTVLPYRLTFEATDKDRNEDMYNDAVSKYLGGNDDRWTRLWWDVAPNE